MTIHNLRRAVTVTSDMINRRFQDDLDGGRLIKKPKEKSMNRLMQFFTSTHLPPNLQIVSRPCEDLAFAMNYALPDGAEKTAGLRKLLEAKDAFMRAMIEKKDGE